MLSWISVEDIPTGITDAGKRAYEISEKSELHSNI
jgi:hypothetical protein